MGGCGWGRKLLLGSASSLVTTQIILYFPTLLLNYTSINAKLEVSTSVLLNIQTFWNVTPFLFVNSYQRVKLHGLTSEIFNFQTYEYFSFRCIRAKQAALSCIDYDLYRRREPFDSRR
jgi:hypothetical protein